MRNGPKRIRCAVRGRFPFRVLDAGSREQVLEEAQFAGGLMHFDLKDFANPLMEKR